MITRVDPLSSTRSGHFLLQLPGFYLFFFRKITREQLMHWHIGLHYVAFPCFFEKFNFF